LKSSRSARTRQSRSPKRRARAASARRVLDAAAVREPREAVAERLLLDHPVQARVLESHRGLGGERRDRLDPILVEALTGQDERAEIGGACPQRKRDPLEAGIGVAEACGLRVGQHDHPGRGA
jgi:hypothetical protein